MKNKKADISLIRKYLNGELDARAMYELERQAQDDPALMDMMQGVESSSQEVDEANLTDLSQMIRQRAAQSRPDQGMGLPVTGKRSIQWRVWIAAASLILISAIGALFWIDRPVDQQLIQDQSLAQDQQPAVNKSTVNPKNKSAADTIPVISEALPEIKTGIALLSRKKINPEVSAKPSSPVAGTVLEEDSDNAIQARRDSSFMAKADVELAKAKNSNDARALSEVVIVGYPVQKKTVTTSSVTTLSGKVAGLSVEHKTGNPMKVIRGVVTDKITKEPLPGAAVLLPGEKRGITTDVNGRFALDVPPETGTLLVSVIGYAQQQVKLGNKDNVSVALSPDNQSLNEVVVVGYGTVRKEKAYPVVGWSAYTRYLEENATFGDGKGGKVTLTFNIDAEGKPSQIRIVKGATAELNQKAASLVENGSRWIRNKNASSEEVKLKIKFH